MLIDPEGVGNDVRTETSVTDLFTTPLFTEATEQRIVEHKKALLEEAQAQRDRLFSGEVRDAFKLDYDALTFETVEHVFRSEIPASNTSLMLPVIIGILCVAGTVMFCVKQAKNRLKRREQDAVYDYHYE